MDNNGTLTNEEREIARDIMRLALREAAAEYSFLDKSIFALTPKENTLITTVCADYKYLYYNPVFIIEKYSSGVAKIITAVIHCVLHCLYLHPSLIYSDKKKYEASADLAVLALMAEGGSFNAADTSKILSFVSKFPSASTKDIYTECMSKKSLRTELIKIISAFKMDDHDMWYISEKREDMLNGSGGMGEGEGEALGIEVTPAPADGSSGNGQTVTVAAPAGILKELEKEWQQQLKGAVRKASAPGIGTAHDSMFCKPEKPSRFSKFSYREYIKRFAANELICEDPETLDMIMYTAGFDIYGDTPIVEFSETKENGAPTDIIIAIDMSGSCSGDVAQNFLRQMYTLFEEMDIKGNVRITAVTFDTEIMSETVIRSPADVKKFLKDYDMHGFGGTNFNCVFEYADNYRKKNGGHRLKALMFFSDGDGFFPDKKPAYKTVFFVPVSEWFNEEYMLRMMPDWAEAVKYDDN